MQICKVVKIHKGSKTIAAPFLLLTHAALNPKFAALSVSRNSSLSAPCPRPANWHIDSCISQGRFMPRPDPYLACDDTARHQAIGLLAAAQHAALAVTDPETNAPNISRIALARTTNGTLLTLTSQLSAHTMALRARPACAFMVGEPGSKGDPLTYPRLMVQAEASFIMRDDAQHLTLRSEWLQAHPKSRLYIDFADFGFVRLIPHSAVLNAGFGKAYRLQPADLAP